MNERARVAAVGVLRSIGTSRGVLLTRSDCAITRGHVTSNELLRGGLLDELTRRQLPSGGWATSTTSKQAALETACLAALALGLRSDGAHRVQDFLMRVQNPNGSWPAFVGDDPDGGWVTSLALIALRDYVPGIPARLRGFHWLLKFAGKESNWLWKWKFRTTDRRVRFDPDKYGWPWFPDTVSWVVPTAFSLVTLKQAFPCCRTEHVAKRIRLGTEMLLDRACPGGGWNAGNGMVFGAALYAHIDTTAIALLALADDTPAVHQALDWLREAFGDCASAYSLAWSALTF